MKKVVAVVGQAGTGKTTWLMEQVAGLAPQLLSTSNQRVLAITRMHGSRRRLHLKMSSNCPEIPCSITTIDGFALSLLNRWRRSLGYVRPIQPVEGDSDFKDTLFGTEADFNRILETCTSLLQSRTVRSILRETYPIIMIDEFQDCHGPLLEFAKELSECATMLLAADEFQVLDSKVEGCPAIEWLNTLKGEADCTTLGVCHRTSVQGILDAARCLRENIPADRETIPVFHCQNYGPAAYKIKEAMVHNARDWQGTTAILCPSHGDFVEQVLTSLDNQLQRKKLPPIFWFHECNAQEELKQLHECLGLKDQSQILETLIVPEGKLASTVSQVVEQAQRFSHLKGIKGVPYEVAIRYLELVVHGRRAYGCYCPKRVVTSIHGAKNREFDNVIILWPHRIPSDAQLRRRWLYNAITRSKRKCMVLASGDASKVQNDPALSLLGPAKPALPTKKSAGKGISHKRPSVASS